MYVDYLLIGQGLAGSLLSYELIKAGAKVIVLDDATESSSSRVAAGIYNPITGRVMKKTWKCDALFSMLEPYYEHLQSTIGGRFIYRNPIYRPFISREEQNDWVGRSSDGTYTPYIKEVFTTQAFGGIVNDPLGGILLQRSGYLDIPEMLKRLKIFLLENGSLKNLHFDEKVLRKNEEGYDYEGILAKKVIYCNGKSAALSKYFEWLPFAPVKGEVLDVEIKNDLKYILNRGVFLLPTKPGLARVGATYSWDITSLEPSAEARKELLHKLSKLYSLPVKVTGQRVGIRPATKDRRPFVGMHPKHENVGIFNGLGTKGVSLGPYFARQFAGFLMFEKPIDDEANITRYFSLYSA